MVPTVELEALVFDFDGLVVDTERPELEAWQAVYRDYGVGLTLDEWAHCIGTVDAFDPHERLEELLGRGLDPEAVSAARRTHYARLSADLAVLPGVLDWLTMAKARGLRVAVASSSPPSWVERHLTQFGLIDRFEHRSCYDGTCPPKPAPDLYTNAVTALGVEPTAALALEDSPNGARAAKAAGLWCVAVPHDLTRDLDLSMADAVIDSLAAIDLDGVVELLSRSRSAPQ
ncbi:MAG: HAD family hydrolase [Acidimicrobiales bacterium]